MQWRRSQKLKFTYLSKVNEISKGWTGLELRAVDSWETNSLCGGSQLTAPISIGYFVCLISSILHVNFFYFHSETKKWNDCVFNLQILS